MAERKLRSVAPGEAEATKPKTVAQAAAYGTDLEMLVALRARIAKSIDDASTPARDLAALSRRLTDIARDIKTLQSEDGHDDISDATRIPDEAFDAATV
jgi:hypothetical protein